MPPTRTGTGTAAASIAVTPGDGGGGGDPPWTLRIANSGGAGAHRVLDIRASPWS